MMAFVVVPVAAFVMSLTDFNIRALNWGNASSSGTIARLFGDELFWKRSEHPTLGVRTPVHCRWL